MPDQHSSRRAVFAKWTWQKATTWLFGMSLLVLATAYIWRDSKSQNRKEQAFRTLTTNSYSGDNLTFSPDGKLLATAHKSNPAIFKVWDLERERLLQTVETDQNGGIGLVAMSPDKTMVVTSGAHDDNRLLLWDVRTGEKIDQIESSFYDFQSLTFSPDNIVNPVIVFHSV